MIRDFPSLKLGIRDLRAKSRRDSGLKVCGRVRMPEMTLGFTGFREILSRDCGIEGPYWGPSSPVPTPSLLAPVHGFSKAIVTSVLFMS